MVPHWTKQWNPAKNKQRKTGKKKLTKKTKQRKPNKEKQTKKN